MCGIYGFLHPSWAQTSCQDILNRMSALLQHRGPDGEGCYFDADIALGHRRLSIIDLSTGAQPMQDWQKRYVVSFNGEIYNFPELRREFEARGFRFQTHSDTEIILAAYHFHGEHSPERLNGMFALALWDREQKKLLLARDRLGKKPLYYYQNGLQFVFASELKALLVLPEIPRQIDYQACNYYLTYGYIPAPRTIFKGIYKLPAASSITIQGQRLQERCYWQVPDFGTDSIQPEERYADELEAILTDAVRCRLISDVPLGAFLSGGIDSSAVVALMACQSKTPVRTFTIDFAEKQFSELSDAKQVARHCKTHHAVLQVTTDAVNLLPDLVWHFDEPFADSSAIPTYYVSKMAREHVTVILSGDGGDELFAGYNSYQNKDQYQNLLRLPTSVRQLVFGNLARALPMQAPMRNFFKFAALAAPDQGPSALGFYPYIKEDVLSPALLSELKQHDPFEPRQQILAQTRSTDALARLQYLDTRLYLPGDILVKVDRMSMANSLETRAPLLDYRLVEFAARLPQAMKMKAGTRKYILKRVLEKYVPAGILTKPKHGFSVPVSKWFQTSLNGFTRAILLDERCRKRGWTQIPAVERVLQLHTQGRRDYSEWIYLLLNLELWFKTFVDSDSRRI